MSKVVRILFIIEERRLLTSKSFGFLSYHFEILHGQLQFKLFG